VKAEAGMGPYAASKAGVHRFTEALAEELKDRRVTVNAVLPSILDTPQNRKDMPDADPGRWVKVEDLAAVMLFLASREARAVTGALLPVTGRVRVASCELRVASWELGLGAGAELSGGPATRNSQLGTL